MIEVLVVDNDVGAGKAFASLIKNATRLETAFTADPAEAIEIVREHYVKVVVLDQRMPNLTGTQLFGQLRTVDPLLSGILFSGLASAAEVGEAMGAQFARYVDKNNIAELPEAVRVSYAEYLAAAARPNAPGVILGVVRNWFPLIGQRLTFEIVAERPAESGERFHVNPANYETYLRLDAGQTRRVSMTTEIEDELIIEVGQDDTTVIASELSAKLVARLQGSLQTTTRRREERRTTSRRAETIEESFELPPEGSPSNPNIRARHFQRAPIYERIHVTIRRHCSCCGEGTYETLSVLVSTGSFATRHVDYLSNNTKRVVETG